MTTTERGLFEPILIQQQRNWILDQLPTGPARDVLFAIDQAQADFEQRLAEAESGDNSLLVKNLRNRIAQLEGVMEEKIKFAFFEGYDQGFDDSDIGDKSDPYNAWEKSILANTRQSEKCNACNGKGWNWLAGAPAHITNKIPCDACSSSGKEQPVRASNELEKLTEQAFKDDAEICEQPMTHIPNADFCPHCSPCRNSERLANAERLNENYDAVLRGLASFVAAGGYNSTGFIDPKTADEKIRWGIEHLIEVEKKRDSEQPAQAAEPVTDEEEKFKRWLSASKYYRMIRGLSVNEQEIAWEAWQACLSAHPRAAVPELPDSTLEYVMQYGVGCRDCADNSGVCPNDSLPCADRKKAIEYIIRAINFGLKHQFIAAPSRQDD